MNWQLAYVLNYTHQKLTEDELHETSDEIGSFCVDIFKISRQKLANQMMTLSCVRLLIFGKTR